MVVTDNSPSRNIKFVAVEFLSTEASFNYSPPLPPSLSSVMLSSPSTRSSDATSMDGDNNNNNNNNEVDGGDENNNNNNNNNEDDIKEGVAVEANVNLRDFSIFVSSSNALPLEMRLIPQTKSEWLLEATATNNANDENDNDGDDDKLALPTDVILAKYRLEYSEELNEEPKHFITLSVSGVKLETDGAINPIMDFMKRSTNPELYKQIQEQEQQGEVRRNFGDGVNLDIQLCDIDFMHSDSKSQAPLKASFKLLPRSEAGILYLRDKFTYKITQMKIKHENDITELNTIIDKSKRNITDLERMLIDSKIALANTAAEREEFSCSSRRLQREKRSLENTVSQLKQEVESFNKLFKAKSDEEMVKEFQNSLKNLFDENARYCKENDALRAENENLAKMVEKMRIRNQEEVSDIQKTLGEQIKILKEENARLKEVIASRDKSLEEAQKGLLDRQLLAEKLSEAERKMDTQRRLADNALRKSNFKGSSSPSMVVTQNMVEFASLNDGTTSAPRTLELSGNGYASDIAVLHSSNDEQSQSPAVVQKPVVKQSPPPLPQARPPPKHHAAPQTRPPSLPPPKAPSLQQTHQMASSQQTHQMAPPQHEYLPPRPKKLIDVHSSGDLDDNSKRKKIASGFNRFKTHINNGVTKMETKLNK